MRTLGLLCVVLAGCSAADDVDGVDDDGKGDGVECAGDGHESWLRGTYFPRMKELGLPPSADALAELKTLAASNPCQGGGDKAYAFWSAAWAQSFDPIRDRLASELAAFRDAPSDARYAQAMTTAMPSAAELRQLEALLAVKPQQTGAPGHATWAAGHQKVLDLAQAAWVSATLVKNFESTFALSAVDRALLDVSERARPETDEERAYAASFPAYLAFFERATAALPELAITDVEREFLGRAAELLAGSRGNVDYLAWLAAWKPTFERLRASGFTADEGAVLDALAAVRAGGGEEAYAAWYRVFGELLSPALQDSALSVAEGDELRRTISVRPCSEGTANAAAFDALLGRLAPLGSAITDLVRTGAPIACQ